MKTPRGALKGFSQIREALNNKNKLFVSPFLAGKICTINFTKFSYLRGEQLYQVESDMEGFKNINRIWATGTPLIVKDMFSDAPGFAWYGDGARNGIKDMPPPFLFTNYWFAYAHLVSLPKEVENA